MEQPFVVAYTNRQTRQLGYKHTFCQNVVSTTTKIDYPYVFGKKKFKMLMCWPTEYLIYENDQQDATA